jgi:hypothetical protein
MQPLDLLGHRSTPSRGGATIRIPFGDFSGVERSTVSSATSRRVAEIRERHMARAGEFFRGAERLAIIEIVRSLDEAAFAFHVAPNAAELLVQDTFRHELLLGAASALRPLLERIRGTEGGVPWGPSTVARRQLADEHLAACGRLAIVERTLALLRYGLATAKFLSDDHLLVEVENSEEDEQERAAGAWLGARQRLQWAAGFQRLAQMKPKIANDIDSLVGVQDGWFIRYDNSHDLVQYHRNIAELSASGIAEAHAITASRLFGGRSFESWNSASVDAYGRVLGHIAFATRLKATHPQLDLRNLLTVYRRRRGDVPSRRGKRGACPQGAG